MQLLPEFPHLYLDTAMALAEYFPSEVIGTIPVQQIIEAHWDRIIYGTDFPNVPYAWDRDLRAVEGLQLDEGQKRQILGGHARRLLKIP